MHVFFVLFWGVYMGRFALHSDRMTIGKTRMLFCFVRKGKANEVR